MPPLSLRTELVSIRHFPDPPGIDSAAKGSLVKGSWHAGGVTEGLHSRHFWEVQTNVER